MGDGFTITGEKNLRNVRILTLRAALKLEVNTGMRLTRGPAPYATIKREMGFRGNKEKVLAQLNAYIEEHILPEVSKTVRGASTVTGLKEREENDYHKVP